MPTPIRWQVATTLSAAEQHVASKLHRIGKFYVFLREIRAELFDEAFEAELAAAYQPRGVARTRFSNHAPAGERRTMGRVAVRIPAAFVPRADATAWSACAMGLQPWADA